MPHTFRTRSSTTHVYIERYESCTDLVEVWCWLRLPHSIEISHINELIVKPHPRVRDPVLWPLPHMRKVSKVLIAPLVELTETGSSSSLTIQLDRRNSKADKPSEHRLLHVGVLLKGHVLDHWRKLGTDGGGERERVRSAY